MSSFTKGRRVEQEYQAILKARGYAVYRKPSYYLGEDMFGLFDIIAINEKEVLLVQVKSNRPRGAGKLMAQFVNHPGNVKKILAIKYDGKGWKEIQI